jgi:putative hydrolase of the HAD superfamily
MPRAILCDLDGVIRHWDERATSTIERRHKLPVGSILTTAFALLEPATRGEVDDEAWRASVREAMVKAHGEEAAEAVDAWCQQSGRIDADVVALLAEQRRAGWRIVLVTNATTRLEEDLAAAGLAEEFDAIICSARVQMTKPDRRIFHLAAERAGCPPRDCVFVDDSPGHVETARQLGMIGIRFVGAVDLRTELARLAKLPRSP